MTYADAILAALARSGRSGRSVSLAAVGHESAIRSIKRGMDVRVSTLLALCRELGLECYVGPHRPEPGQVGYDAAIRESEPLPPWVLQLKDDIRAEIRQLLAREPDLGRRARRVAADEHRMADLVWSPEPREIPGAHWVDCYAVQLAPAGRARLDDSTRVGCLAFRRTWLDRHGLDASHCAILRVGDESMAPTLNDGSTILVNLAQRRRRSGRLFAIRTEAGLVIRRADRDAAGRWQLICDHPGRVPGLWPDGAEILGQVQWGARIFT